MNEMLKQIKKNIFVSILHFKNNLTFKIKHGDMVLNYYQISNINSGVG